MSRKKSVAQLKTDGTFRKDRHEITISHKPLESIPIPFQSKSAEQVFNDLATILLQRNLLFAEDIPLIESLAHAIYQRDEMTKRLALDGAIQSYTNQGGHENLTEHPANKILKSANETIMKITSKFGFNLLDKNRIKINTDPPEIVNPIMKALE